MNFWRLTIKRLIGRESGVAPTQVGWVISAPRASILLSACVGCKRIYLIKIWLVVAEKPKKWVVAGFFGLSSITGLVSRQFHSLLNTRWKYDFAIKVTTVQNVTFHIMMFIYNTEYCRSTRLRYMILSVNTIFVFSSSICSYKPFLCQKVEIAKVLSSCLLILPHWPNPGHGHFLIPPAYSSDRR